MYSQNARRRAHTRSPRRVVARRRAPAPPPSRAPHASRVAHTDQSRDDSRLSLTHGSTTSRAHATRIRSFVRARRALAGARGRAMPPPRVFDGRRVDRSRASRDADDGGAVPVRRPRRRGARCAHRATRGDDDDARSDATARRRERSARSDGAADGVNAGERTVQGVRARGGRAGEHAGGGRGAEAGRAGRARRARRDEGTGGMGGARGTVRGGRCGCWRESGGRTRG